MCGIAYFSGEQPCRYVLLKDGDRNLHQVCSLNEEAHVPYFLIKES
jgi:hypothetical protein